MLKINKMRTDEHNVQLEPCPKLTQLMRKSKSITEADAKAKLRLDVQKIRNKYSQKTNEKTKKKQAKKPVIVFDFTEKELMNAN